MIDFDVYSGDNQLWTPNIGGYLAGDGEGASAGHGSGAAPAGGERGERRWGARRGEGGGGAVHRARGRCGASGVGSESSSGWRRRLLCA